MPEISVVAPVYNQHAETLIELVRRLSISVATITNDFEVLLVDDGSVNGAWSTISEMARADPKVRGLHLAKNFGQHVAITAGLDHADGNWVVVMDADLQDRPEVIPSSMPRRKKVTHVVFVNRMHRPEPLVYRLVAASFYLLLNALSGQDYNRLQGNFSIVSANVVRSFRLLREPGRFYAGILRWVGFKHGSISAAHAPSHAGQTSYSYIKRIRFAFALIVSFSTRLLYISIFAGLMMATVSFVMAGFIVVDKILYPDFPLQGWPSVMTAIFFTAGVTNVTIGLTGIYIGQIFQQTKGRPLYVVAAATSTAGPGGRSGSLMKLNDDQIRDYWRNQAVTFGEDHRASWTDGYAINLEIAEISKRLHDGARVIDIGCANGYSTINYALRSRINIKGVDYIPEMIAAAKGRLAAQAGRLAEAVTFEVGDILALDEPDGWYDAAIVTRVVINLDSREKQVAAIRESARIVKPGGILLISEATREGLLRLNLLRSEWGLPPIPEPPFNNYIDEELARTAAPDLLDLQEISNFASTYFVGSRVLKPLLAKALGNCVDPANAEMEWNRFFSQLPAAGDYGTQKLFVFRRK